MRKQRKWTDKEITYLKNNYTNGDINEITKKLDRTISSITNKAFNLNLEHRSNKLSDLSPLLLDTNEAYYWMGFLMADGHFSKSGQIQVNLSKKDLPHLIKFSKFVNYEKELNKPSLYVGDKKNYKKIKNKFNLNNNKTYSPPKINVNDINLLYSLIIGFIDGDGTINKDGYLYIKCDSSWLTNINYMLEVISNGTHTCKINKDGLTNGYITNIETMKKIKIKAISLKIPLLSRKWDRINLKKMSKKETRHKLDSICFNLFNENKKPVEVIKNNKISSTFVYASYKRWKEKK